MERGEFCFAPSSNLPIFPISFVQGVGGRREAEDVGGSADIVVTCTQFAVTSLSGHPVRVYSLFLGAVTSDLPLSGTSQSACLLTFLDVVLRCPPRTFNRCRHFEYFSYLGMWRVVCLLTLRGVSGDDTYSVYGRGLSPPST